MLKEEDCLWDKKRLKKTLWEPPVNSGDKGTNNDQYSNSATGRYSLTNNIIELDGEIHVYSDTSYGHIDRYPRQMDELGLVYIEGEEIKLLREDGESIVIGRLDGKKDFTPIETVIAKKKLLEDVRSKDDE